MAQKFGSPGVFTTEIDQSFLDQGTAGVGAVMVGGALKGPAMIPIRVGNFQEFVERFGSLDTELQLPYAARNYLKNASVLNVVRVLGHSDGTSVTAGYSVGGITGITDRSGSNSVTGSILAVVHHSGTSTVPQISGVPLDADRFVFKIGSAFAVTASFLTGSDDYIEKVLNTDPTRYDTDKHYLAQVFKYSRPASSASWHLVGASGSMNSFAKNFSGGSTPWLKSQPLGGMEYELFKFHTLGHGRYTMDDVKISIQNVRPSVNVNSTKYGSFDLVVRSFDDTDLRPVVLETFANLNLNPEDRNYIGRRIGDQLVEFDTTNRKFTVTGDFRNRSKYIRVEINKNNGSPAEALPWGFRGFEKILFDLSASSPHVVPSMRYVGNMKDGNGTFNSNIHFGVQFLSGGVADRMWTMPVMSNANLSSSDTDFSLKHLSASYENNNQRYQYNTSVTNYSPIFLSASVQKFSLPLKGGFDGLDLRLQNPFDIANGNDETDLEVVSFQRALDTISNPDELSFNLLAVPGVHNLKVADKARTIVNDRTDAMYIMDVTGSTVSEVVNNLKSRELDDNYTACYYPDVKVDDPVNNRIVRVSPSTVVVGAYAYSDRVGQVFFAPAGLNRGGLEQFGVVDVTDRLNYTDRSNLYDNRVNPIATFPDQGIVVFGQKTLQVAASALDRVNVRRLLIHAKQTISSAAKTLVFEPNNPATYQRFLNKVNPILERIRQDQGLERFQVVMDTNLNTPDVVDRNIMRGKIFLQPTKVAEFIDLSFIITNAGVQFSS